MIGDVKHSGLQIIRTVIDEALGARRENEIFLFVGIDANDAHSHASRSDQTSEMSQLCTN